MTAPTIVCCYTLLDFLGSARANVGSTDPCGPPALQPTLHRRAVLGTGFSAYAVSLATCGSCLSSLTFVAGAL
jgi:hypothetical protein